MKRYKEITDLFSITCKNCGSTNIDIWAESCDICRTCITAKCNTCTEKYDSHDFMFIEEEE